MLKNVEFRFTGNALPHELVCDPFIHRMICRIATRTALIEHRSLHTWRHRALKPQSDKAQRVRKVFRHVLLWSMVFPLICIGSIPSFSYVLATNIPANSQWWQSILSEPLVISFLQVTFNALFMPPIISRLAAMFYMHTREAELTSDTAISISSKRVMMSFVIELGSSLISPIIATMLIDEACQSYAL